MLSIYLVVYIRTFQKRFLLMPLDPCFAELLADPRNGVRPPPAHVALEKVRRVADGAMDQGDSPDLPEVRDAMVSLDGRDIPIRHYRPIVAETLPVILFCHGGGFVWGSIDTHDGLCRRLAVATGAAVISIGYRLSPETRFPGPVEDAFGVLRDVVTRAQGYGIDTAKVALCGDSAGGAICVSVVALAALERLAIHHLCLFYPALDPSCGSDSQQAFADGYMLTRDAMKWFWSCYLGSDTPAEAGFLPLNADLSGFPPTTIATAEFDPLRDEAEDFHARLVAAGGDAKLTCFEGLIHGFLSLPALPIKGQEAFDFVTKRLCQRDLA